MAMNRAYGALSWAMTEMPTGKAQAALSRMYNEMPNSSEAEEDQVVMAICTAVYDGLAYGNWIGHTPEENRELAERRDARRRAKGE